MILTDNIPEEMKAKKQWIGWNLENERKIPKDPNTGGNAKSNDAKTWDTFGGALAAHVHYKWTGIGYVFNGDYVGVDLDHCINGGGPNAFAKEVLQKCSSYTEYSPSETGIHIIGKGSILKALKTDKIEIYNIGRYFTMTGHVLYGRKQIEPIDVNSYYKTQVITQGNGSGWMTEALESIESGHSSNGRTPVFVRVIGRLKSKGLTKDDVKIALEPWAKKYEYYKLECLIEDQFKRYPYRGEQNESVRSVQEVGRKPIQVFSPKTHTEAFLASLKQTGDGAVELSTGFPALDKCTGGLERQSLVTVGARKDIGKTAFCTSVAEHLLKNNKKVVIFSTERPWTEVYSRFMSIGTNIKLHTITRHQEELTEEDRQKIAEYAEEFKSKSLHIIEESQPNIRTVSETVCKLLPDVFIFDYVQNVEEASELRHADIERFMKAMKDLAKRTNTAGLIASQLNRAAAIEPPALHHLSGSAAIENLSNAVILLSKSGEDITIADVAANKGPKLKIELKFDPITARFSEL